MLPGNKSIESARVLIHAPFGRDGALIQSEAQAAGFSSTVCASVEELCASINEGAGAALIADEALAPPTVQSLAGQLAKQPPWSDFPLLIMTSGGASTRASRYRLGLIEPLGNVTLLERPLRPVTLLSSLRAALRARRRQYELAGHLARLEFLSELGEATRSVTWPDEVTAIVTRRLAAHLQVSRSSYAAVDPDSGRMTVLVEHDAGAPGMSSFDPPPLAALRQGRPLIDCGGPHAAICCPLVKEGRLVALLSVQQAGPREWTAAEVELVEEVVERCWSYIERERLVAKLAENNRILTRANRELEEFAYVASHDLQEPIRMVRIYTELMLKQLADPDPAIERYGHFVRQGAGRMEELIRDLLSFSRAVHTEAPAPGAADLSESLAQALAVLKNRIEENGAVIKAQQLPVVSGDTSQLAHVFQNLIANSIKYRKETEPPEIDISAGQQGNEWIVTVRDNGIGFEQQYAARIFGLFKRLHKDKYPGTGLGLAICQRIVERYGGRMWAVGKVGEGAAFHFSLPRYEAT